MVNAAPVLVCHRGASALAAENSLDAFRIAMEYGIDYSELDVHISRDGDLVVTHDAVSEPAIEDALPRLADVFALVRGRMGIYVDLKGDNTGYALCKLIRSGAADEVQLISGSARPELVEQLRAAEPRIPRSILFTLGWDGQRMIDACNALGAVYAHPCFRPIDTELINRFHAAGLKVMTPHTNNPIEAHYFVKIGVDVIASDDPRILLRLRG
jgi:glycerophosphoryl diester phosphodiesterase